MKKEIIDTLLSKDLVRKKDYKANALVSIVLAFASFLLLIINFMKNSYDMTICSLILSVGFSISFLFAYVFKNEKISGIIIALLVGFILSFFAISGGNNGFAILWIILVPVFAVNLLGIKRGFLISTYFLVFIIVLFYTPLNSFIEAKYSKEFISRFPILLFADYIISMFLSFQKEYYYRIATYKSYIDDLTKTYNRRYFIEEIVNDENNEEDTGLIVIDVNGLKIINDTKGHQAGDDLIKAMPECFKLVFGDEEKLCRIGGDEYATLVHGEKDKVLNKIEELKKLASTFKYGDVDGFSFSIGYASKKEYSNLTMDELFSKADELMYDDKSNFYKTKKNDRRKR